MTESRPQRLELSTESPPAKVPADFHILVVDDEPDVRIYLASVLEDEGFRVETAADGAEALEIIHRDPPDLISLDLVMPNKSGIRVMAELRRDRELSRIPVVIVTGHSRDTDVQHDLEQTLAESTLSGPLSYLDKPVTPQKYRDYVCTILGVELAPELRTHDSENLRRQAAELLADADPATLEAVIDALKRRTP